MKTALLPLGLIIVFNASACRGSGGEAEAYSRGPGAQAAHGEDADDDDDADEFEEDIALDAIPSAVRAAALAAVPGFVIKEAEREVAGSAVTYCLEGTVDGEAVEVEVSADGRKVVIEEDDAGDDDENDDG